jgi:hypothetical protein
VVVRLWMSPPDYTDIGVPTGVSTNYYTIAASPSGVDINGQSLVASVPRVVTLPNLTQVKATWDGRITLILEEP